MCDLGINARYRSIVKSISIAIHLFHSVLRRVKSNVTEANLTAYKIQYQIALSYIYGSTIEVVQTLHLCRRISNQMDSIASAYQPPHRLFFSFFKISRISNNIWPYFTVRACEPVQCQISSVFLHSSGRYTVYTILFRDLPRKMNILLVTKWMKRKEMKR